MQNAPVTSSGQVFSELKLVSDNLHLRRRTEGLLLVHSHEYIQESLAAVVAQRILN